MIPQTAMSDWIVVSQEQIDRFADATGDHQWLHVDPTRAASESPYGATVAHGFLILSLVSRLLRDAMTLDGIRMAVNYGLDHVRFPAPLTAGSRIRARFDAASIEEKTDATKVVSNATV